MALNIGWNGGTHTWRGVPRKYSSLREHHWRRINALETAPLRELALSANGCEILLTDPWILEKGRMSSDLPNVAQDRLGSLKEKGALSCTTGSRRGDVTSPNQTLQ